MSAHSGFLGRAHAKPANGWHLAPRGDGPHNVNEESTMYFITLSDEQLNVVTGAHDPIAVHDAQGRLRGYIALVVGDQEIADAKRALASKEARYTTSELLARLAARSQS